MNPASFGNYLLFVAAAGAVVAVINLARVAKRGPRAYAMAVAGLALGAAAWSYRSNNEPLSIAFGVIVFIGLVFDFVLGSRAR